LFAAYAGLVTAMLMEAPGPTRTARFDVAGLSFAFAAFFGLNYVLSFGERRDWLWGTDIVLWSVVCVLGFAGFIWRELCENRCGFIQLRLFNIRNLAVTPSRPNPGSRTLVGVCAPGRPREEPSFGPRAPNTKRRIEARFAPRKVRARSLKQPRGQGDRNG
jgi:hypothetical protein